MRTLTPVLKFDGKDYLMLTPQIAGIAARDLGADRRKPGIAPRFNRRRS